jgi:hypothetical protein
MPLQQISDAKGKICMDVLSEKNISAQLLDFLSSLPNISTVVQRQTFVDYTGIHWLAKQIIWEGDTLTFFGSLLRLLAKSTQPYLLEFLTALEKSPYVPFEQQEYLALLSRTLTSFTAEQWDKAFTNKKSDIYGMVEQCQRASALEMKVVGSKYITDLYFPRSQIEANFKSFLMSDATCFLIVAKAGRGKTNLLCHLTEELQNQHPTLFLSGRIESRDSNGILVQIASRLGYGENWLACFKNLSHLADNGFIPLIIVDGINESATPPKTMQAALRELLFQASLSKVKVCVTCRTDFWNFYRESFWKEFSWRDPISRAGKISIEQDLPFFPPEDFDQIASRYFNHFHIQGRLVHDAWDSYRNPLLLRFFCEAYHDRNVGEISQIRLYPLFSFFWDRKIENIQDVAGEADPYRIHKLILTLAKLMYQQHQTKISKEAIAKEIGDNLRQPG